MTGRFAFLIIMAMAFSCRAADISALEPKPFSDDFTEDADAACPHTPIS